MTAPIDESVHTGRDTYRYLRAGMVVVIVMLFAAIFIDSVPTDCWQGSISAYYYTAARNVFVATLCCLGIMLIVYKGSNDTEDVLLNLAGTLAFFVAFVPVSIPEVAGCRQVLPTAAEKSDAIANNFGAVIVALVVAGAIIAFVFFVDKESRSDTSDWGNRLRVISCVVLAGFVVAYLFFPEQFEAGAHWVAAVLIFVIIGAVVFINAYLVGNQDKQDRRDSRTLQAVLPGHRMDDGRFGGRCADRRSRRQAVTPPRGRVEHSALRTRDRSASRVRTVLGLPDLRTVGSRRPKHTHLARAATDARATLSRASAQACC